MKVFQGLKKWTSYAFNLPILQKDRLVWVDYLRGIAIILVVYRHTLIGIERSGGIVSKFLVDANMIFYSFRMPLFFILAGLFISATLARKKANDVLAIKFENLLYPYLIWAFIQITLQIIFSKFTNSDRSLTDYTYIFYHPRNLDQFWYLPALFNVTIIYVLIKVHLKLKAWMQVILGAIFYLLSPIFRDISIISDWMAFYFFFALGDIVSQLFFTKASQKILKSSYTLLAIIPVFILVQLFYLNNNEEYYWNNLIGQLEFLLIALIGCFTMFVLAFCFERWNLFPFLRVIGYHSLYIYVMHVLVIAFLRIVCTKLIGIHNTTLLLITGIFFGATLPVIFYNLFVRNGFAWFLFSFKKRRRIP
jgi:fucose 4-O-acetylase-like acetyltransferase